MTSTPTARATSLAPIHAALGATVTDFAGWSMPLRYTSETVEHRAVRSAAGLFDLGHMGQIDVTGPDAAAALDFAMTRAIAPIAIGRARYAMICTPEGGVIDDLVVYRLGEQSYFVVANASNADAVLGALVERVAGFDAQVALRAHAGLVAVQGPASAAIIESAIGESVADLNYYAITAATVAGAQVLLGRTGYTGEDGFELFCSADDAPAIWAALTDIGAGVGLIPAGLSCRDTLRLEVGMALYGNELSLDRTPYEAGLGRVVDLDKGGDFVGRDALRTRAEHLAQTLVGIRGLGRRVPRHGFAVLAPNGTVIGEVTSGAPSPTLGYPIAMAYVDSAYSAIGTKLTIEIRGSADPAVVVEKPFYRRGR